MAAPETYEDFQKKYVFGGTFGIGTVSIVKLAKLVPTEENPIEQEFAAKISERARMPDYTPALMEVEILSSMNHDKIVKLFDYFLTERHLYLILEYVQGRNLWFYLENRFRYTQKDTAKIMHDLASALAYLHSVQIVHGDINPKNLVLELNHDSTVKALKVIDFGCARYLGKPPHTYHLLYEFIAPEIRFNKPHGCNVDVWSAGVVSASVIFGLQITAFDFVLRELNLNIPNICVPEWYRSSPLLQGLLRKMLDKNENSRITGPELVNDIWINLYNN